MFANIASPVTLLVNSRKSYLPFSQLIIVCLPAACFSENVQA